MSGPAPVYGYISLEHADEAEIDRLTDQLTKHAFILSRP